MPVPNSIDTRSDSKQLKEYRALKSRYSGPLSKDHVPHIVEALRDIVPNGRYTGINGEGAICVQARDLDGLPKGFDHILVVFSPVNKPGDERMSVEEFLSTYNFFAPDCA